MLKFKKETANMATQTSKEIEFSLEPEKKNSASGARESKSGTKISDSQAVSSQEKVKPGKPERTSQPANQGRHWNMLSARRKEAMKKTAKLAAKKFIIFMVSHVGLTCLVVAYSIMGGFIFQNLEGNNEKTRRVAITGIRSHYVQMLWNITESLNILYKENWTASANDIFWDFQKDIYGSVKDKGWDGTDEVNEVNFHWTYAGSLLYSVTVITTIGFGHLTPKTLLGRLTTILYAVIGIPMTLLCLANIGTFLAQCLRIFWFNVTCQPFRRYRRRSMIRSAFRKSSKTQSSRVLSGTKVVLDAGLPGSSDGIDKGSSVEKLAADGGDRRLDGLEGALHEACERDSPFHSRDSCRLLESSEAEQSPQYHGNGNSLPLQERCKPLCDKGPANSDSLASLVLKTQSHKHFSGYPPTHGVEPPSSHVNLSSEVSALLNAAKREPKSEDTRVPITVCFVIVTAYILLGAMLFSLWEEWPYFQSVYFCFITLSTIGFGDVVPGYEHDAWGNQAKRVSCTLYLLFGLALVAMCFELIQSECRQKFRSWAKFMGLNCEPQSV